MSVNYQLSGDIAHVTLDDGKVNAFSAELFRVLNQALDQVEADRALPLITGREGIFSAGYHLGELAANPDSANSLLELGASLCCRLLDFPSPVIAACTGHAFPMGAFVLMCCDYRVGAEGAFRIGLNEVRINIPVPRFATEVARGRLHPSWFNRTAINGEMFDPIQSVQAGFLDAVVAPSEVVAAARAKAEDFCSISREHHLTTKRRVRAGWINAIQQGISEDLSDV